MLIDIHTHIQQHDPSEIDGMLQRAAQAAFPPSSPPAPRSKIPPAPSRSPSSTPTSTPASASTLPTSLHPSHQTTSQPSTKWPLTTV